MIAKRLLVTEFLLSLEHLRQLVVVTTIVCSHYTVINSANLSYGQTTMTSKARMRCDRNDGKFPVDTDSDAEVEYLKR